MGIVPVNWRITVLTDHDFSVLWPRRRGLIAAAVVGLVFWLSFDTEFLLMYLATVLFFLAMHRSERRSDMTVVTLSFCLPGYRESLRRQHFIEGGLIGLALALWVLHTAWFRWNIRELLSDLPAEFPRPEAPEPASVVLGMIGSFFGATAIAATLGALAYSAKRWIRGVAFFSGMVCVFIVVWGDLPGIAWFALLPVWLALGLFAWKRLGDIGYITQGQRRFMNDGRRTTAVVQVRRKKRKASGAERFLVGLMRRQDYLSPGRYYWGEIHQSIAWPLLSNGQVTLVVCVVCALLLGLLGEVVAGLVLVISGTVAGNISLPLAPDRILLLPAGRRERYVATGMKVIAVSLLLMVFGAIVIAWSWLLWLLVRALPGEYLESAFSRIHPTWLYWPCLLAPWAVASRLLRGWAMRIAQGSLVIVALLLVGGVFLLDYDMVSAWRIHAVYVCILASGWLLLLMALRASCRAGDLWSADA